MYKIELTHGATTTTYINNQFPLVQVTRRENGFSTAMLTANNYQSKLYPDIIDELDLVKVSFRYKEPSGHAASSWTQVFEGLSYSVHPMLAEKSLIQIKARGLGYALDTTHCNIDYGKESSNPTKDTAKEIWDDIITNYVNKSFGGAVTGHSLTNTFIANIQPGLSLTHLNNPYRPNSDVVNRVCQIVCAYRDGSAGPHWFVNTDGDLIINTIGAHEDAAQWPDWWNTDEAGSTLVEAKDFVGYVVDKKAEAFANKILFLTDFRRPNYDYWTETGSSLWGVVDGTVTDDAGVKIVGANSLRFHDTDAIDPAYCYYPSTQDAGWDITDWGSSKTVPVIGFYGRRNQTLGGTASAIRLFTTDYDTDYFKLYQLDGYIAAVDEWYSLLFRIGPHYLENPAVEGSTTIKYKWYEVGSPDWTDINGIAFTIPSNTGVTVYLYIDDLHFGQGKIIREAYNSTNITANKEHQLILLSKTAMDDSGIATDDSGVAAQYAYAELLRRQKIPLTITFTVPLKTAMLPGQKVHVHACKKKDGTFNVDVTMRILKLTHNMNNEGFFTSVTATDDLTNSFPLTTMDHRQLLTEYVLINNKEALDLKSGDVDLLIPRLSKDYP